mmetsp:Transcript_14757/g.61537  ORF Transcript_14757/g.61537 Transcript_14757/m.61537 type:complete len:208 (+) Transcript_14757:109-732(+)
MEYNPELADRMELGDGGQGRGRSCRGEPPQRRRLLRLCAVTRGAKSFPAGHELQPPVHCGFAAGAHALVNALNAVFVSNGLVQHGVKLRQHRGGLGRASEVQVLHDGIVIAAVPRGGKVPAATRQPRKDPLRAGKRSRDRDSYPGVLKPDTVQAALVAVARRAACTPRFQIRVPRWHAQAICRRQALQLRVGVQLRHPPELHRCFVR